jgi:hypothetical protein
MGQLWQDAISDSFNRFVIKVTTFLPDLLAMITILIVGLLIASIVKRLLLRFLKAIQFDKLSERWGLTHVLTKGGVAGSPSHLLSQFFYWVIVLVTIIAGINALEVPVTQHVIAKFFNYLPHLFAAILILVVGYLVATFLGQAALIAAVNAQIDSARLFSRAVRWLIVILALTMALYHLGIAEKVIIVAFTLLFGGIVLALAIAFGWGGRELAKDFLDKLHKGKERGEDSGQDRISHI